MLNEKMEINQSVCKYTSGENLRIFAVMLYKTRFLVAVFVVTGCGRITTMARRRCNVQELDRYCVWVDVQMCQCSVHADRFLKFLQSGVCFVHPLTVGLLLRGRKLLNTKHND